MLRKSAPYTVSLYKKLEESNYFLARDLLKIIFLKFQNYFPIYMREGGDCRGEVGRKGKYGIAIQSIEKVSRYIV
jgi:hypothetical protein